jgi:hypothetical protein
VVVYVFGDYFVGSWIVLIHVVSKKCPILPYIKRIFPSESAIPSDISVRLIKFLDKLCVFLPSAEGSGADFALCGDVFEAFACEEAPDGGEASGRLKFLCVFLFQTF